MSIRFIIRKNPSAGIWPWELRDAVCPGSEVHAFATFDWPSTCSGSCNSYRDFTSAVEAMKWAIS